MSEPRTATPVKFPVTGLLVCGTVLAVALLVCITLLAWNDKSTDDISRIVNTLFNFVSIIAGGGAFAYSRTAARNAASATENAATAATQTNGGLDVRIEEAVSRALAAQERRY